ncbi:hypothetical protein BP6252_09261 [Coleophoma cylindrospora]|uniref:Mid2 domain-containing protein n=1 Tax=Coleophoma cylindrospora TaxID=1849047 RepID=A0A3D8R1F9_9HELO|nr:hypothetical protein BP6252_09261 [Coleophoma cylindrospora]
MNAGSQGASGSSGSSGSSQGSPQGGSSNSGGSNVGAQAATTTSQQQNAATATTGFQTSTTSQPSASSTAVSSQRTASVKGTIIGGVVGGLVGLLLLAMIAICIVQRKQRKAAKKRESHAEPVTYVGLNSSFAGARFGTNAASSMNRSHDEVLLYPSQTYQAQSPSETGRGGDASPWRRDSPMSEADYMLPTYAESQSDAMSRMGSRTTLGRINTSHGPNSDNYVSPMSTGTFTPQNHGTYQNVTPALTPQQTGDTMGFPRDDSDHHEMTSVPPMPRIPQMAARNRDTVDTMGFPLSPETPDFPGPCLVAPMPVRPIVHQQSLEAIARRDRLGVESPILGFSANPPKTWVPQTSQLQLSPISQAGSSGQDGVARYMSQRTISSTGSFAPQVIDDAELERLGVGNNRNLIPPR